MPLYPPSITNIISTDGSITIVNPNSIPDLTVVKAPKLTTARTIGGVSFDGTANITVATATAGFTVTGGPLNVTGARSTYMANSEPYSIGAAFDATGGNVYFGAASNSATPDGVFSTAAGNARLTFKNSGVIQFNASYGIGAINSDASGNLSSVSDERLKIIQGKYTVGLREILQINPILYKWNKKSNMETEHTYAGFSAQNVQKALGEYGAMENNQGYLSLSDRAIMAGLVNSIKELTERIKELEKL